MSTFTHTASSPRFAHLRAHLPGYLVGIGATAALTAGALVVFLSLAAFVTFNGLPFGGSGDDVGVRVPRPEHQRRPRRRGNRPTGGPWRGGEERRRRVQRACPHLRGRRGLGLRRLRLRRCAIGRRHRQGPLRAWRFAFTGGGDRSPIAVPLPSTSGPVGTRSRASTTPPARTCRVPPVAPPARSMAPPTRSGGPRVVPAWAARPVAP